MNWQSVKSTIKQHIWGPVGSVIFHIILIIILIKFAVQSGTQQMYTTQEVVMDTVETKNQLDNEPQKPRERKMDDLKDLDKPEVPTDVARVADSMAEGAVAESSPQDLGFGRDSAAAGFDVAQIKSPLILKGLTKGGYSGRFDKGGLGRYAGGGAGAKSARARAIDEAIMRALGWLKAHQRDDGGWSYGGDLTKGGGDNDIAMSGLALLAFLAYGQTTSSSEFGPTVEKAINFLKVHQDDSGYWSMPRWDDKAKKAVPYKITPENCFQQYPYIHGIATYAIAEAYGMTRIPELKTAMEKAVQIIILGQQKSTGGWDYSYAKGARRDTSVSAWQVQALKASLIAGCTVPGIKDALDASVKDMKHMSDSKTGKIGYEKPGQGSMGLTGAGVLCLQFTGHGKDTEAQAGLRALHDVRIAWEAPTEQWPLYAFYYITQSRFQESRESFATWQAQFVPAYIKSQNADGHWDAMGGKNTETGFGQVYATTFSCLTLETFVRFLPSYQHVEESAAPTNAPDDVIVKVL